MTCGFPGVHELEMPVSLFLRQTFTRCLGGGSSFGDHILFNFAYFKPSWSSKLRNRNKNDNEVLIFPVFSLSVLAKQFTVVIKVARLDFFEEIPPTFEL